MTTMESDTAVSDLIAVMALIAVFVTVAAIIGVTLLSYPPGDAAPAMIARSAVAEDGNLYIYHDGGDPLERGHFELRIDGRDQIGDAALIDASGTRHEPGTWTTWETGEALVLAPDDGVTISINHRIQIVGEGMSRTGSNWLLHEIGNVTPGQTVSPTPTQTATPTPTGTTPTPTGTISPPAPVANFTANITSGLAPLAVQFTDASTGSLISWNWAFGDGTTSAEQSPGHTYTAAGNYTVSLTATGPGGSGTETKVGYITVLAPPAANFTANVTSGPAPLAVNFTDQSAGNVTAWFWNFGDGTNSTAQNPIHTYAVAGTYTVTLNASNAYGNNTTVKGDYITVTSPQTRYNILLNTAEGKSGSLMQGGYLEFRVTGANSYVELGGTRYNLAINDTVRLVMGANGNGNIFINGPMITVFSYNNIVLYINNNSKGSGSITGIYISNHSNLVSTLTLNVPAKRAWTKFEVDGQTLINGDDDQKITLYNLMPGADGKMNLDNSLMKIYFEGSIASYTLEKSAVP